MDPPSGAITLLFTDIEGSTKLLQRSGDLYPELLAQHRRLLRAACDAHRGYEVDAEGDAFFVTFASAADAAAAATAAQRALAEHRWPDGHRVSVRMGLHSGEPRLIDGGYVGLDVHRGARVMAAGHGGQIVLSHATRRQLADRWAVVELGEHQLKDLLQPEPLYQLNVDGLPRDFPPLKALGNRPTNLPTQPNPLIGREAELREIADVLRSGNGRLLTLTGPGGTGKTRLALQSGADLLDDFRSGVFFVSLAPVVQEELLLETVARTLAVQEVAGERIAETLKSYLGEKRMLLILDNLEQIVGGAPAIADLLAAAQDVHVLATSRERLNLAAERVYDVPPLVEDEAIALFIARAQAVAPNVTVDDADNEDVATLCRRLEGLPLALELAAARTTLLSLRALLAKLDERLSILTSGRRDADERHQTLRGTIEWSYDLLDGAEQDLFRDLSVFVDGCRFDAAVAVSDAKELDVLDLLQSLVDKSLVRRRVDGDGESRYWMLETIREYATERAVASGTAELLADRHGQYFLALAERAEPDLWRQATKEWIPRFDAEQANIRSALEWALRQDDAEVAYRLAGALYPYWELRGRHGEARAWLTRAFDRGGVSNQLRLKALIGLGRATAWQGDRARAVAILEEAVAVGRDLGDDEAVGRCLGFIGHAYVLTGQPAKAAVVLDEGVDLARRAGDAWSLQRALSNAAMAALELRDFASAQAMYAEALELARVEGLAFSVALCTAQLGWTEMLAGDFETAQELLDEASALYGDLGDTTWTQMAFRYRALLALFRGDIDSAESLLLTSLADGREQAPAQDLPLWIENLAAVADAKGDRVRAATLFGAAHALFEEGDLAVVEENRQVRARYRSDDLDAAAWARGKAMTLDEAIDYALRQETTKR